MSKYKKIKREKLNDKAQAFYDKIAKATDNFENKSEVKRLKTGLDNFYAKVEANIPEAIEGYKKPKAAAKSKPATKAKSKPKAEKKPTKKKASKKPAYKNVNKGGYAKLASEIMKKEGITYRQAQKKASSIFKEAKDVKKAEKAASFDRSVKRLRKKEAFKGGRGLDRTKMDKKTPETEARRERELGKDAKLSAKPFGKRKSKEGNTYYEYRDNRADAKQPQPSRFPRLADGGMVKSFDVRSPLGTYAKGGMLDHDTSDVYFFAYEEQMKNGRKFKSEEELYGFVNDGYAFPKYSKKSVKSAFKSLNENLYAKGGSVSIVNKGKKFDRKKYPAIMGDFDGDGIINADDPSPRKASVNKTTIEPVEFNETFDKLLKLKAELDSTMIIAVDDLKAISPDDANIYARTKTPFSIMKKLVDKRLTDKRKGLTDLVGTTVATDDYKDLKKVDAKIKSGKLGKVIEREDMYLNPKGGYRAIHYLVDVDGHIIEVQLKTKRQKAINELSHEAYKKDTLNQPYLLKLTALADKADRGNEKAIKELDALMKNKSKLAADLSSKKADGGMVESYNVAAPYGTYAKGGEVKDIEKFKKQLIAKAKNKGIYENFGQKEVSKLEDKYGRTTLVSEFDEWATWYDGSTYAKGGITKGQTLAENFNMKDEVQNVEFWKNDVIVKDKQGKVKRIDLDKGERISLNAKGGEVEGIHKLKGYTQHDLYTIADAFSDVYNNIGRRNEDHNGNIKKSVKPAYNHAEKMSDAYAKEGDKLEGKDDYAKGGLAKGYHKMPDGRIMKDSEHFAKGGTFVSKETDYISNRDIVSVTIKKGGKEKTFKGSDILDGIYVSKVSNAFGTGASNKKVSGVFSSAITGRNKNGEKFGVVIGSYKEDDEFETIEVRETYGERIKLYRLEFDNGKLREILDYGYSIDGNDPSKSSASGVRIGETNSLAKSRKELARVFSKSFSDKIHDELSKALPFAKGGNVGRDAKFLSEQSWEQDYKPKRKRPYKRYKK